MDGHKTCIKHESETVLCRESCSKHQVIDLITNLSHKTHSRLTPDNEDNITSHLSSDDITLQMQQNTSRDDCSMDDHGNCMEHESETVQYQESCPSHEVVDHATNPTNLLGTKISQQTPDNYDEISSDSVSDKAQIHQNTSQHDSMDGLKTFIEHESETVLC